QPTAITASASAGTISCNGGTTTLTVTASGGTGTLQYSLNGGAYQSGNTFTVNAAGSPYTVTVRDANSCTGTTNTVTVTQPTALSASSSHTNVSCFGATNGTVTATGSGGTPSYGYVIAGPTVNTTGALSGAFTGLTTGTYSVTVTDSKGCTATTTQTVANADNVPPTINCPATVNVTANSGCTATGVVVGTPATSDNCSVASVTNNAPASFPVGSTTVIWTVTDNSGNTATCSQTVNVTDVTPPTAGCPLNQTYNLATGINTGCKVTVGNNATKASPNDNCPGVTTTWILTGAETGSGTNNVGNHDFNLGITTITYTARDAAG